MYVLDGNIIYGGRCGDGVTGGDPWKAHTAMTWVHVFREGYHVITKVALCESYKELSKFFDFDLKDDLT